MVWLSNFTCVDCHFLNYLFVHMYTTLLARFSFILGILIVSVNYNANVLFPMQNSPCGFLLYGCCPGNEWFVIHARLIIAELNGLYCLQEGGIHWHSLLIPEVLATALGVLHLIYIAASLLWPWAVFSPCSLSTEL